MTDRRTVLAGGGLLALAAGAPTARGSQLKLDVPPLLHAFRATVTIGAPQELGLIDGLKKRVIPITGGVFAGRRLSGKVLPGGADWQSIRPDGVADIWARYTLQAEDGTLISVTNPGYRRGPPEVLARVAAGEAVDPALYYFRTAPRFETRSDGPHAWLNASVFVCTAARFADRVELDVYEVG
jgi:hypothetical protein